MSQGKFYLIAYNQQNRSWFIPFRKEKSDIKQLYWGSHQVPLAIQPFSSKHAKPVTLSTKGYRLSNGKICCGPLIGILTTKGSKPPFGGNHRNFIDIMQMGASLGSIVFVFTPEGVNWAEQRIKGYLFNQKQKKWFSCDFPMPNVIYNRVPTRSAEMAPTTQECIQRLRQNPDVQLFNPHFFDKKEIFQLLKQNPTIAPFLPTTKNLQTKQDLKTFLDSHPSIYLKPAEGKAGAGIMKVTYDSYKKEYHLIYQTKKKTITIPHTNLDSLWTGIKKHSISSPYILQEAIEIARYEQSTFDVRTLVQKDKTGDWQVTGTGVRVAGRDRITTHVPQGGRIERTQKVLDKVFSEEKRERILAQIRTFAISVAQELERHYGHLGEMSMDIGVDREGKIWFFEANSKPMKFDEPKIRSHSLKNLIEYSQYLSFQKGGASSHAMD